MEELTIEVRALSPVRGVVAGGKIGRRPTEIKVVFNKTIIENIFRTKEHQEKFMMWVEMLGHCFDSNEIIAENKYTRRLEDELRQKQLFLENRVEPLKDLAYAERLRGYIKGIQFALSQTDLM